MELLNHLVVGGKLQPLNLHVNTEELCRADLNFRMHFLTDKRVRDYLRCLLGRVVVLALESVATTPADFLRFMFEVLTVKRQSSSPRALALLPEPESSFSYETPFDTDQTECTYLDLRFLCAYLLTLPDEPPVLPYYQGLSVLEVGYPVEPASIPHLSALLELQHSLKYVSLCLLDSCRDSSSDALLTVSADESKLYNALTRLFCCQEFQHLKNY